MARPRQAPPPSGFATIVCLVVRITAILLIALLASGPVWSLEKKKKKKSEEEITQTLPELREPPSAVTAETGRLEFHLSPLVSKGLLSQQARYAIKALLRASHGGAIVKLRAFVAGTGDMRRVSAIVSETFNDKHLPLPVLSVVQVGLLPLEGAQVVIESASVAKGRKKPNPNGLAFFSGQQASTPEESVGQLKAAVAAAGMQPAALVRATCFLSSLDRLNSARAAMQAAFPSLIVNYVQLQRAPLQTLTECEAVGRLAVAPNAPVRLVNPAGLSQSPNYSQIALVGAPKIVLSAMQMGFRAQDADVRLAFDRLQKALESQGATMHDVFWSSNYPLTRSIADKIRAIRFDYFDKARPPAGTFLLFESLPSIDATFALDVIAAPAK